MKYKLIILLPLMLLLINPINAENTKIPMRAMFYSAIFPGGGQIYNGSYIKAGVVMGLQVYWISNAVYNYDQMKAFRNQHDYQNETLYHDDLRSNYWWIGTTLVLSIADAYVDAHLYNFQKEKKKVHVKFEDKLLQLEYRF